MPTPSDMHVNAMLTNLSVAYMQSSDKFIADKVFPIVPVQKQSDRYYAYDKGDFFRDEAAERAPGTESAGGDYSIDNTPTYYCREYAFHKDVSEQERNNADAALKPDQDATDYVSQKMLLKRESIWVNSYFKTGVWTTERAGVASGATGTQFNQWDASGSTPIKDIMNARIAIAESTGFLPNTLTIGPKVYAALCNHADILDRIKYTQRGVITTDILAGLFDVDKVLVPYAVVNTAAKGKTATNSFFFGKSALLSYAAPNPGLKTPSAGYLFSWVGNYGAGAMGNRIRQFPMIQLKSDRIEGELCIDCKLVAADLGAFFNAAVS